ncbi:MAG TPA: DUF2946 family protein [Burkholderiaceae bacterium]|nr:DUF2946 family protein [Burkholderiaceae bacterium]
MKRFFVLLLAVLLPLQFAWGAAAAYCQHETTTQSAAHLGHHQHVHKAEPGDGKVVGKVAGKLAADYDCGYCNTATAAVMPAFETPLPSAFVVLSQALQPEREPASAPQRAPDRPQWPRLV